MFTGIIETTGTIAGIGTRGNYRTLKIQPGRMFENLNLGESIAVDGCCLTVTACDRRTFMAEASQESLALTLIGEYVSGGKVNLERAMTPTSRLGGHFVTGHIDVLGKIASIEQVGESWRIGVSYPGEFNPYLIAKGSVALNGISLTVNELENDILYVNIIPHTFGETTVANWKSGSKLNLEFDLLGKYIVRQMSAHKKEELTIEKLIEAGW